MTWAKQAVIWTIIFVVAYTFGVQVGYDEPPPPPPPVVVTETKTVPGPERKVEKKVMPKSCAEAVRVAANIQQITDRYEASVGGLPRLLDSAGVAIHNEDNQKLNRLREDGVKLESDSIQALLDLRAAQESLASAQKHCKEETG